MRFRDRPSRWLILLVSLLIVDESRAMHRISKKANKEIQMHCGIMSVKAASSGSAGSTSTNPKFRSWRGEPIRQGGFPWAVVIHSKMDGGKTNVCSGSLISTRHVITAAHCIPSSLKKGAGIGDTVTVLAGSVCFNCPAGEKGEVLNVKSIAVPSSAEKSLSADVKKDDLSRSDLAILELEKEVDFAGSNMKPICLPQETRNIPRTLTGYGYGVSHEEKSLGETLRFFPVSVTDDGCTMAEVHEESENGTEAENRRFGCGETFKMEANPVVQTTSICEGDAGGGVTTSNVARGNSYVLYGIVRSGDSLCEETEHTTFTQVFVRLSYHHDFICSQTGVCPRAYVACLAKPEAAVYLGAEEKEPRLCTIPRDRRATDIMSRYQLLHVVIARLFSIERIPPPDQRWRDFLN